MPFLPHLFYRNASLVANHAMDHPESAAACLALLGATVEEMARASLLADGARFIRFDFEFPRHGYALSPGWVCGLANGFCLRALVRIEKTWPGVLPCRDLARELALAYRVVNSGGRARPWFTYVDPEGNLWFDEYPGDDGVPTLVLNGHIHATLGLFEYALLERCVISTAIVDGAITTLRFNLLRFRNPGRINHYSLREPLMADYLPDRTVRQLREMAGLSGDPWFAEMQLLFAADLAAHDRRKARARKAAQAAAAPPAPQPVPACQRLGQGLRRLRAALWSGGTVLLLPLPDLAGLLT